MYVPYYVVQYQNPMQIIPNGGGITPCALQNEQITEQDKNTFTPVKRIAVEKAYGDLCAMLKKYKVRYGKKTFGKRIIRVCSRTIVQLTNITELVRTFIECGFIEEIGMPMQYSSKMKSLVLFLKPKDASAAEKIECAINESEFQYHIILIDSLDPSEKHASVREEVASILAMDKEMLSALLALKMKAKEEEKNIQTKVINALEEENILSTPLNTKTKEGEKNIQTKVINALEEENILSTPSNTKTKQTKKCAQESKTKSNPIRLVKNKEKKTCSIEHGAKAKEKTRYNCCVILTLLSFLFLLSNLTVNN